MIKFRESLARNWSHIHIDREKLIASFDLSKDEDVKEASIWKNIQSFLKKNSNSERVETLISSIIAYSSINWSKY